MIVEENGKMTKTCNICNEELIWENDYDASCHRIHKGEHHICFNAKRDQEAKDDFENGK